MWPLGCIGEINDNLAVEGRIANAADEWHDFTIRIQIWRHSTDVQVAVQEVKWRRRCAVRYRIGCVVLHVINMEAKNSFVMSGGHYMPFVIVEPNIR